MLSRNVWPREREWSCLFELEDWHMKRILFVDDEPNVLDGLRRMLRSMRAEWDITFAAGAREALDLIQGTGTTSTLNPVPSTLNPAFDVVVSDMRMPE